MATLFHPIDFDALEHGDVITWGELRRIYNVESDDDVRRCALRLREDIWQHRNMYSAALQAFGGLKILTPAEAEEYSFALVERAARAIVRHTGRRALLDRSSFTPEQKSAAEFRDHRSAAYRLAIVKERRRLAREEKLFPKPKDT